MTRRPSWCRLGMHQTYRDSGWFNSVSRCDKCDWVADQEAADLLDRERRLWSAGPPGEALAEGLARVALAMAKDKVADA